MTYFTFLLVFLVPPILLLALTIPRDFRLQWGRRAWTALPLVSLIAFFYTTPWDNYLVYREVWGYGSDRVLGVIGYVPIEEYLFFVLQPFLTGLFLYHVLGRSNRPSFTLPDAGYGRARLVGAGVYGVLTLIGIGLLLSGWEHGLYLGLILAWAGPVLLGLWLFGGAFLWQRRHVFLVSVAIPTVYLWIADRIAIGLGIWDISNRFSLDIDPLGLPLEEAVFFLVTNLLVVQGVLLILAGDRVRPIGLEGHNVLSS